MCWAQHFTLDIPLMPLHCTPQNPDLSPGQRADWPHIYRRTASLCDGGRIYGDAGVGEKYFNKLATLDLIDFHFE